MRLLPLLKFVALACFAITLSCSALSDALDAAGEGAITLEAKLQDLSSQIQTAQMDLMALVSLSTEADAFVNELGNLVKLDPNNQALQNIYESAVDISGKIRTKITEVQSKINVIAEDVFDAYEVAAKTVGNIDEARSLYHTASILQGLAETLTGRSLTPKPILPPQQPDNSSVVGLWDTLPWVAPLLPLAHRGVRRWGAKQITGVADFVGRVAGTMPPNRRYGPTTPVGPGVPPNIPPNIPPGLQQHPGFSNPPPPPPPPGSPQCVPNYTNLPVQPGAYEYSNATAAQGTPAPPIGAGDDRNATRSIYPVVSDAG